MFAVKPKIERLIRVLLSAVVLLNACVSTAPSAKPEQNPTTETTSDTGFNTPRSLSEQAPRYFDPPHISYPQQTPPEPDKPKSPIPSKDEVDFKLVADPATVPANGLVNFSVFISNHSDQELTGLIFTDQLENGLEYDQTDNSPVMFDKKSNEVSLKINPLRAGDEYIFNYSVIMTLTKRNAIKGKIWLHDAELKSGNNLFNLKTDVALGVDIPSIASGSELAVLQSNGGWNQLGRVAVQMEKDNVGANSLLVSSPVKINGKGPSLQFKLDLLETDPIAVDSNGKYNEQTINIKKENKNPFKKPAFLEINLDDYVDLNKVPAGQEPYVATYDETNKIWVKVPIIAQDDVNNSVIVETTHFSTWGAGLGSSLPQNGANVLLFDQPYTSLFTGSSRYSIPVWTPPGRAGMQPDVSLSYSSGTVDGVLGDVQAPWVGVGWNIDGVEIVRQVTTDENGYGYKNDFALTLNGSLYQLVRDENSQNRYYTDQAAFLYVERHNYAFDNEPSTVNTTGEWWEVVTTDGTRYRLGWNNDSEQLALMYGYSCTTNGLDCYSPNGAYASLGYAGKAKNMVALRWRVDRVTDTYGNYMEYHYHEEQPSGLTTLAQFDRESYLQSISYAGFEDPEGLVSPIAPAYQVKYTYTARSTVGDIPTEFNIWDNLDSKLLDNIQICYGSCGEAGSTTIRTYQFGYTLAAVPNANGTLTLTSLKITGGGYTENGQDIPSTSAPTIKFTYQNLDNRAVTGSNDKYTYPRLYTIDNGSGGKLTFSYETDGRGTNSWYNYRVKDVSVDGGMGLVKKQSYTYSPTPVYSGQNGNTGLGSLIGYPTVTESLLDFNNTDFKILDTKHTFGTVGLDIGRELQTELLNNTGTVLRKTTNTYVTDNSRAPFTGWNYRYLGESDSYVRSGGALVLTTKSTYYNDPGTGNPLVQSTYSGNSLYRKTYYEYVTNPDPAYYILDKASRVLLVDANNQIYSDTHYHYDGEINQAPTRGDLTLVQTLTGNPSQPNETVDSVTNYDNYGNAVSTRAFKNYGSVDTYPSSDYLESTTTYDETIQTYPVTITDPMHNSSTSDYLYTLGIPYQTTDPNNWTTKSTYDGLGRTLSVTPPGLNQAGTVYIYPELVNGTIPAPHSVEMQILDTIAGKYRSVWGIYDGAGRMLQTQVDASTILPDENKLLVNTTLFNAQGLPVQQSLPYKVNGAGGNYIYNPGSQFTTTEYDTLGRVIKVTAPGNIISQTSYDGLTTTSLDPNNNKVSRTTDGFGRMTTVAELSDAQTVYATTKYFYDAADHLINVRDAQLNTTTIQYDWLGRKLGMDDPDMGVWSYNYNSLGTMSSQTDARNQQLTFEYDNLNRLTKKFENGQSAPLTTYTYGTTLGTIGLRTSLSDASGSTTWNYSDFGRTVTESRTIGGEEQTATTHTDWLGRAMDTSYGDGEVVSYEYDDLGRPKSLKSDQTTLVNLAYNTLGQISTQTLGNGVAITNTYDYNQADNTGTTRLTERKADKASVTLLDLNYVYDLNGNITRLTDKQLNETQFYQYDFLNRLTSAVAGNGIMNNPPATPQAYGQQYQYDKVGNILQVNDWGSPSTPQAYQSSPEQFQPVSYNVPAPAQQSGSDITIGETNVLSTDDSGNGDLIVAQQATLSQSATIQSLSFYVTSAAGNLRLGVYADNGGNPGALIAETAEFTPTVGWNTQNVLNPTLLSPGTYWLTYLAQSNDLHFRLDTTSGEARGYTYSYGALPSTFSTPEWSGNVHWSFYATLQTAAPSSFPSTSILDNFNRGNNSALGTNWTAVFSDLSISSNRAAGSTSSDNGDYYNAASYGPDVETYTTITTLPGNNSYVQLWARLDLVNSNTYFLEYEQLSGTDAVRFWRVDGGSSVIQIGSTINQNFSEGDSLGFRIVGSVLTAYYKPSGGSWTSLGSATDSTYSAAGQIGLAMSGTTGRVDDFGGGNFANGSTPTPTLTQAPPPSTSTPTRTSTPLAATNTPTRTSTTTKTPTPFYTPTKTATPSSTATLTFTATATSTPSMTASATFTSTFTPSATATRTLIPTNTPPATYTSTITSTATPPFYSAKNWSFDSTTEGWTGGAYTSSFVWQTGGYAGGNTTGIDPQILSVDNLGIDITNNKLIKIRFKNTTASTSAAFYFITNTDTTWNEAKDIGFSIVANSNYTEYTIDASSKASWIGTLKQLRFDPGYTTGSFSVDYIKIGSTYLTPTPTLTVTPVPATTQVPSQSLMAYWDFENVTGTTVPDVALNDVTANNASLVNGAAIQTPGVQTGSSVFFDGSSKYATVADQAEIKKNGSFTVSAWVNPSAVVTNRTQYIINKGISATDFDYGFITTSTTGTATPTPPANVDANGKLVFRVGDLTPNKVIGPVLPINTWTLVTGVYDSAAGELRLYVNGTLSAVEKVTGTVSMGTGALTFSAPSPNQFSGSLDEVHFYNRALSEAEMQQLFPTVNGTPAAPTPLPSITPTATSPATFTPTPTALPISAQQWGTGDDGDLTVSSTFNINTQTNGYNGRTCADSVAYSVTSLGSTVATLSETPAAGCLSPGDEVMLINIKGISTSVYNTGIYEFLRVGSVNGNMVVFAAPKSKWYGDSFHSDVNIGIGGGKQRVMLIRVPNYNKVTVNGTLTGIKWDGGKKGLIVFRVAVTLTGNGTINASGLGYNLGGEGYTDSNIGGGTKGNSAPYHSQGGGGGYATPGQHSPDTLNGGKGGAAYGVASLERFLYGAQGGDSGDTDGGQGGGPGGAGGGGILILAKTINFAGTLASNGQSPSGQAGGGAGGSIRIEGETITLNTVTAIGGTLGGLGRIAIYYQNSFSGNFTPGYLGRLSEPGVPTLTPTATPSAVGPWGTGQDGDLIVNGAFNINAQTSGNNGRTCLEGGDAVSYSVVELNSSWAKLSSVPYPGCLFADDEILLINLKGTSTNYANTGKYEFLRIGGIVGNTIYFKTPKVNFYGNNPTDDSNISPVSDKQKVMLMRVPNYNNVTVNGTLTGIKWDGGKKGLIVFRVAGTLTGNGTINASGLGYNLGGEGYTDSNIGGGGKGNSAPYHSQGGGGGYATPGQHSPDTLNGGKGGAAYGVASLERFLYGAQGGDSGDTDGGQGGGPGGAGGGGILILAKTINFAGTLASNGQSPSGQAGGGAGGSIRIEGETITLNTVTAIGGTLGGLGRIAIYYANSLANSTAICAQASMYCQNTSQPFTLTPTPIVTVGPPTNPGTTGLVSWWTMNETSGTRQDSHSTNGLIDNNTVGSATGIQGGTAANFVKANQQWLSIADNPAVSTGDIDFTISAWVYLASKSSTMTIASKYGTTWPGSVEYTLVWHQIYDRFIFIVGNGTMANTVSADTFGSPQVGQWYFVTAWHNAATNEMGISVNNITNTASTTIVPMDGNFAFKIGSSGVNEHWDGRIDEVALYKRVLTPAERTWLYNNGAGRTYTDLVPTNPGATGLVSWWTMNETSGTRNDSHGTNNLTDNNTVTYATGLKSNAASFVLANSEYLSLADNPSISTGDIDFTLAASVYLNSITSAGVILDKSDISANIEYRITYNPGTGFRLRVGPTAYVDSGPVSPNTWYNIIAWHDAVHDTINIQINSGAIQTLSYSGGTTDMTVPLVIGAYSNGIYELDGRIDEVALYKRVLTSAERTWLYNNGAGRTYSDVHPSAPAGWSASSYTYAGDQPHAVTSLTHETASPDTFEYDENGNMTCRVEKGVTYKQDYNSENRISAIHKMDPGSGGAGGDCSTGTALESWTYVYDGDGVHVSTAHFTEGNSTPDSLTRYYFGGALETSGTSVKKYYSFGGGMVAMKDNGEFKYFLTDQLGSVSVVLDADGNVIEGQRYLPFGEPRTMAPYASAVTSTDHTYTGQRNLPDTGLMDYHARFYSPSLKRFIQPDSIIPGASSQSGNRYNYVLNNPIRYNDPTGHKACDEESGCYKKAPNNYTPATPESILKKYNVTLDEKDEKFSDSEKWAIAGAVIRVGRKLAETRGHNESITDAFVAVYDHIAFKREKKDSTGTCGAATNVKVGGCTNGAHAITFWSMTGHNDNGGVGDIFRMALNVVHELGHAFYHAVGDPLLGGNSFSRDALIRNPSYNGDERLIWEQHPISMNDPQEDISTELFADTFLAWTYGAWNPGPPRSNPLAVDNAKSAMDTYARNTLVP